jgi:hypothetical protein
MARKTPPDPQAVFLNIPYDAEYEPVFIGLVAALLALGRKPRCTLELPDRGQGRPLRICQLLETAAVSFHDLSRVRSSPPRFNMPFELGLAFALKRYHRRHHWYILEEKIGVLDRTLSDLKGTEQHFHRRRTRLAIACLLDVLGTPRRDPDPVRVARLARDLSTVAADLKSRYGRSDLFYPAPFRKFMAAGIERARAAGFIRA